MTVTTSGRAVSALILLLSSVAAIDAAIGGAWDIVVLGSAVALCAGAQLIAGATGRIPVPIRGDLARWLERSAAEGGEQAADVADRAVAAYRVGLTGAWDGHGDVGAMR